RDEPEDEPEHPAPTGAGRGRVEDDDLGRRDRGQRVLARGHDYIRSGALTPRRPSPERSTCATASLSHSRVRWRSVTGSPASGVTRHASYQRWYVPASSSR